MDKWKNHQNYRGIYQNKKNDKIRFIYIGNRRRIIIYF